MTIPAAICLGISAYAAGLVPFLLLVDAEHLTPRVVREALASARAAVQRAALSTAALVLLLSAPKGALR
ncbi:hypothetical protein [Streptomyces longhuiensis]|uniref:hypothetical protein n=1 Tax=Streptomyces longhuiensis TaxID=2880933 RepID=UPI001D09D118|nr:hypothetical protein [Streptomyces longhuiensis]UDM00031.1 hypothetical protein LGI35_17980 [Streptomyces longhuiensis]